MKIGVTSQNFRTITGHAGKSRRFKIFEHRNGEIQEKDPLDLSREMSMHEFRGDEHPLDQLDVLITAGSGKGFVRRMASRNVKVITTSETDPLRAVQKLLANEPLPAAQPHEHHH